MRKGFEDVKRELKYFDDFEKAHINPKNNKKIGKNDPNAHFEEMKYNCVQNEKYEFNDFKMLDDIVENIKFMNNFSKDEIISTDTNKKMVNNTKTKLISKINIEDEIDYENIYNNTNNKINNNNDDSINIKSKCFSSDIF